MSTLSSHATSLLRQPQTVICRAHIAQGKKEKKRWSGNSSHKSLMNALVMDHAVSRFIYSENPCSTPTSWKQSGILRRKTVTIRYFLQLMELYLTNSSTTSWNWELTGLSGLGGRITLHLTPSKDSRRLALLGSLLKKHLKKSLKSGRSSRGLK